eukprot:g5400.t1
MVASDDDDLLPVLPKESNGAKNKNKGGGSQQGGDSNAGASTDDPTSADAERLQSWCRMLVGVYGWRLIAILVLSQHLLKGFVFSYLATSFDFVLKFYQVSGPRIQIYKAVTLAPWALKPLFGVLSDRFPLFGYRKNSYMALVTVVAMCATGYVGVQGVLHYKQGDKADSSPLSAFLPLHMAVFCYFLAYMQISVCDLLTEARYAEAMRAQPAHGPDLMTFVWGGISIGAFVGTLTIGWVLESIGPFFPACVCAMVSSLMLYPLFRNWLQEEPTNGQEVEPHGGVAGVAGVGGAVTTSAEASSSSGGSGNYSNVVGSVGDRGGAGIVSETPDPGATAAQTEGRDRAGEAGPRTSTPVPSELVFLSFFVGGCALALVGAGLMESVSTAGNLLIAVSISAVALLCFQGFCSPAIANMNFFTFLQTSMSMSIEGATFYFFTDTGREYPEGPHFSIWFYTTGIGIVASIFNLVGMVIYNQELKTWRYHKLFMVANVVQCVFSLLGILVFTRVSKNVLGIPDHVFILGGSVILSIVHQWMWLPGVVLLSQLCPKGVEATMYALLAGCHNIGNSVGQIFGAWVLERLDVQPDGTKKDAEQFDSLWIAAAIGTILPMFTLILLPYFIPDATQQEVLLSDDADGVQGSWYQNYLADKKAELMKKEVAEDHDAEEAKRLVVNVENANAT